MKKETKSEVTLEEINPVELINLDKTLATLEKIEPIELFTTENAIEDVLSRIEGEVTFFTDCKTPLGRKNIASMAYKVSRSKTILDKLGKTLVAEWKQKAKKVDNSRKKAREYLDDLRDRVREPLNEWEKAEEERIAAEKLREEIEAAEIEAHNENDLFNRQLAIEKKEAEIARIEEEKRQADLKEKQKQEQIEREAAIRSQAIKEAEEKAIREKAEAEQRVAREKQLAEERIIREKIEAEQRIKAAEQKAVRAKQLAEEELRRKQEEKRIAREKVAANKQHREKIFYEAFSSFVFEGISEELTEKVLALIDNRKIQNVTINY